jgi:hypothetical protein
VNLETIVPRERSGSLTQARFAYQTEFIVFQCIDMLGNPDISKVYCDFHSDCVVKDNKDFHVFYSVKGIKNKLISIAFFKKEAMADMFHNFSLADGFCRSVLVTNAQVDSELEKLLEIKENLGSGIATTEELAKLTRVKDDWRPKVDTKGLFNLFIDKFEIIDGFPTFSERSLESGPTLKSTNIDRLKSVLDNKLKEIFPIEDVKQMHEWNYRLAAEKSQLKVRSDRFITPKELLDKIYIPKPLHSYFDHEFTEEEIDNLKDQSILAQKLKNGAFSKLSIKNAKKVRYYTRYLREQFSQNESKRRLIDEFEYRLTSTCADVYEDHIHNPDFDPQQMLRELKNELKAIAYEEKFATLNLDKDFIKGLIWEATSQCNIWWEKTIEQ